MVSEGPGRHHHQIMGSIFTNQDLTRTAINRSNFFLGSAIIQILLYYDLIHALESMYLSLEELMSAAPRRSDLANQLVDSVKACSASGDFHSSVSNTKTDFRKFLIDLPTAKEAWQRVERDYPALYEVFFTVPKLVSTSIVQQAHQFRQLQRKGTSFSLLSDQIC